MIKRKRAKIGDLIKVPFDRGVHTYARILVEGSYAFYDCPSIDEATNFDVIISSDILFIAHVDIFAIKEGHWTIVGNIPLEQGLAKFYPRYFNPAPTNSANIAFYEVYKEEIETAISNDWIKTGKIQIHGVYGREHIEERLRDYYDGKRYLDNKRAIWLFKRLTGFTTKTFEDFNEGEI